MTQNTILATALESRDFPNTPEAKAALKAIIEANPAQPDAFRQAIMDHRAFWQGSFAMNFEGAAADNEGFLAAAGGGSPKETFAALRNAAAAKKVRLDLKSMTPAKLGRIITAGTQVDVRRLVSEDFANLADWDPETPSILSDATCNMIQFVAQQEHVAQGIARTTDYCQINELFRVSDDMGYQAALEAIWNIENNPVIARMDRSTFTSSAELKSRGAKKGLSLFFHQAMSDSDIRDSANRIYAALNGTGEQLRGWLSTICTAKGLTDFSTHLQNEDIDEVKRDLGLRYLVAMLPLQEASTLNQLVIAADVGAAKAALNTIPALSGDYLNLAITAETLPQFKSILAAPVLVAKIAEIDDLNTLDALARSATVGQVKEIVGSNDSLGFRSNAPFLAALTKTTPITEIKAAASVQKSILSAANPTHLLDFIYSNADYLGQYNKIIGGDASPEISRYLEKPEHLAQAKRQAVLSLMKRQSFGLPQEKINLSSQDRNRIEALKQGSARRQLPFLNNNPNLQKKLKAYETVAAFIQAPEGHFSDGEIIALINNPVQEGFRLPSLEPEVEEVPSLELEVEEDGTQEQTRYVNTEEEPADYIKDLSQSEKQEFQAAMATSLMGRINADLTELTQAKTIPQFRQALNNLGISSHGWVNLASMKAVQSAAFSSALRMHEGIVYAENRPNLEAFVTGLPFETRKALATDARVLRSLSDAADFTALERILGGRKAVIKALIAKWPERIQKELLENQAACAALRDARSLQAIGEVLAPYQEQHNLPGIEVIGNLLGENRNRHVASALINSELAAVLMEKQVKLTVSKVRDINDILLKFERLASVPDDEDSVSADEDEINLDNRVIDEINEVLRLDLTEELNAAKDDLAEAAEHNIRFHERFNELDNELDEDSQNPKRAVEIRLQEIRLLFLMSLPKYDTIKSEEITSLEEIFEEASTAAEFIKKIEEKTNEEVEEGEEAPFSGVLTISNLKQHVTPAVFRQAKLAYNREKFSFADQSELVGLINAQNNASEQMRQTHQQLKNRKVFGELKLLAETDSFDWLNAGFQSAAKQDAYEMESRYLKLDEACASMCTFFQNEEILFKHQLDALPQATNFESFLLTYDEGDENKQELWERFRLISKQRDKLEKQLLEAHREYARYRRVQLLLRGDLAADNPLLKEGILHTLQEAKKGGDIRFLGFDSYIEDLPVSDKAAILNRSKELKGPGEREGLPEMALQSLPNTGYKHFVPEKAIPPGHLRVHSLILPSATGRPPITCSYLEETNQAKATLNKEGKREYATYSTLTLRDKPPEPAGAPGGAPKPFTDAECSLYMAMAMHKLKSHGLPTKEKQPHPFASSPHTLVRGLHKLQSPFSKKEEKAHPIVIAGTNERAALGVWLALMTISRHVPNMAFDPEAIESTVSGFDPSAYVDKKPLTAGYIRHPLYDSFKSNTHVVQCLRTMQEFSDIKYGIEKAEEKERTNEAVRKTSEFYKNELKGVLHSVEAQIEENQEEEPILRSSPENGMTH